MSSAKSIELSTPSLENWRQLVEKDVWNFEIWTRILAEADKLSRQEIETPREIFNAFLEKYPLCFGYWKKFADAEWRQRKQPNSTSTEHVEGKPNSQGSSNEVEARKEDQMNQATSETQKHETLSKEEIEAHNKRVTKATIDVYERGTRSATYSIEHWQNYFTFCRTVLRDHARATDVAKRVTATLYLDPRCISVWTNWIQLETDAGNHVNVGKIFTNVLSLNVPYVQQIIPKYLEWVKSKERTTEEVSCGNEEELTTAEASVEAEEDSPSLSEETKQSRIKNILIRKQEAIAEQSRKNGNWRDAFEKRVTKRMYFHVNPLDTAVLSGWNAYLDQQLKHPEVEETIQLFERCLVATANYTNYWLRFSKWLHSVGQTERALGVLSRARTTFVPGRPEVHILTAQYAEFMQQHDLAEKVFKEALAGCAKEYLPMMESYACFLRRTGRETEARKIFSDVLDVAIERHKLQSNAKISETVSKPESMNHSDTRTDTTSTSSTLSSTMNSSNATTTTATTTTMNASDTVETTKSNLDTKTKTDNQTTDMTTHMASDTTHVPGETTTQAITETTAKTEASTNKIHVGDENKVSKLDRSDMQYYRAVYVAYVRFVAVVDPVEAYQLALDGSINYDDTFSNTSLWYQLIATAERCPDATNKVKRAYEHALQIDPINFLQDESEKKNLGKYKSTRWALPIEHQAKLWLRYVDFCRIACSNISEIVTVEQLFEEWKANRSNNVEILALLGIRVNAHKGEESPRQGGHKRSGSQPRERGGRDRKRRRRRRR